MDADTISRPAPVAQPLGYTSKFDKAEQASSSFVASSTQPSFKSSTFSTGCTQEALLLSEKTRGKISLYHML
jgi:hypothetical protein